MKYRVPAAGRTAIADERDWLGGPLGEVPIDECLQRSGVAVVVLRCDDDESVRVGQLRREFFHAFGSGVVVTCELRWRGRQRQREVGISQISDIDIEATMRP